MAALRVLGGASSRLAAAAAMLGALPRIDLSGPRWPSKPRWMFDRNTRVRKGCPPKPRQAARIRLGELALDEAATAANGVRMYRERNRVAAHIGERGR